MFFLRHFSVAVCGVFSLLLPTTASTKKVASVSQVDLQDGYRLQTELGNGDRPLDSSPTSATWKAHGLSLQGSVTAHFGEFLLASGQQANVHAPSQFVSALQTSARSPANSGLVLWALVGLGVLVIVFLVCWIKNKQAAQSEGPSGSGVHRDLNLEQQLQEAMVAEDAVLLAKLIQDANSASGGTQVPRTVIKDAEEALDRLKARELLMGQLASAMAKRDKEELRNALSEAEASVLSMPYLQKARNLLQELDQGEQAEAEKPKETGKE